MYSKFAGWQSTMKVLSCLPATGRCDWGQSIGGSSGRMESSLAGVVMGLGAHLALPKPSPEPHK